jgi:hypothetical protein
MSRDTKIGAKIPIGKTGCSELQNKPIRIENWNLLSPTPSLVVSPSKLRDFKLISYQVPLNMALVRMEK